MLGLNIFDIISDLISNVLFSKTNNTQNTAILVLSEKEMYWHINIYVPPDVQLKEKESISSECATQNREAELLYNQPLTLSFTDMQQLSSGSSASSVSSLSGSDVVSFIFFPI